MRSLALAVMSTAVALAACSAQPISHTSGSATTVIEASSRSTDVSLTIEPRPSVPPFDAFANQPPGAADCHPASPRIGNEILGTGPNVQIHGLVLVQSWPIRVGDEVKIVWRMTGSRTLTATSISPSGVTGLPAWGPEAHTGGSTFDRPGDEFGVGYVFTEQGCWQLHLQRADTAGDVWISVTS